MPFRRAFMPRRTFVRRRPKFQWVRSTENNVTPSALAVNDLLGVYRTTAGITVNPNDWVLWRLHFKLAVQVTQTAYASNNAAMVAIYVGESDVASQLNPITNPYREQYLMWDNLYVAQQELESHPVAIAPLVLFKEYDIKARRKLRNINETLWFTIAFGGATTMVDYSFTQSALWRVPG